MAAAAALRAMAEGWGLSAAGVQAICAARPPLSHDGLLALGAERARLEAALGAKPEPSLGAKLGPSLARTLADWEAVERGVRGAHALISFMHQPSAHNHRPAALMYGRGGRSGRRWPRSDSRRARA